MTPVERVERCRTLLLRLHCLTHTISSIEVCVRHWKNFDIRSSMLDCCSTSSSGFISLRKESNRPEGVVSSWAGISSTIVGGGVSSSCSRAHQAGSCASSPAYPRSLAAWPRRWFGRKRSCKSGCTYPHIKNK